MKLKDARRAARQDECREARRISDNILVMKVRRAAYKEVWNEEQEALRRRHHQLNMFKRWRAREIVGRSMWIWRSVKDSIAGNY